MINLHIRQASQKDAGSIATILRQLGWFQHLDSELYEQGETRIQQHLSLCLRDESHTVYVAEDSQTGNQPEIVGYIAIHWLPYLFLPAPEGYISELFIANTRRGQGVGKGLLNTAIAEAKVRGCARLMLINSKHRESYQRQFYTKQGWQERNEVVNFIYML